MYSYRIEQAIRAAAVLHHDQRRQGAGKLPYITHLMAVTVILHDYTNTEDVLIAALLHDTLEDTEYTEDELRSDFGDEVVKLVKAVTEPKNDSDTELTWLERKEAYVNQLRTAPEEALLIAAADKIHNMRAWVEEYYDAYDRFLKDFPGSLDERLKVYHSISNILNSRLTNDIISEFNHVYSEYKKFIFNVKDYQETV